MVTGNPVRPGRPLWSGAIAPVHDNGLAGNKGRIIAGEEECRVCYIPCFTHPAHRLTVSNNLTKFVEPAVICIGPAGCKWGCNKTGTNTIDAHLVLRQFKGNRFGQFNNASLGDTVQMR